MYLALESPNTSILTGWQYRLGKKDLAAEGEFHRRGRVVLGSRVGQKPCYFDTKAACQHGFALICLVMSNGAAVTRPSTR